MKKGRTGKKDGNEKVVKKSRARKVELKEMSEMDTLKLVQELQTHQIELEMQNEELRRAQEEIEKSRKRYSDLYDFAPVGYLTFNESGTILEANLTSARQLGVERESLIGDDFYRYIVKDDRDVFYLHLRKAFGTRKRQISEIRLVRGKGVQFYAQLESVTVGSDRNDPLQCLTALSDITERRQVEKKLVDCQRQLRSLAIQLSMAEEREKRHIAAELHDCIGQSLALTKIKLESLRESIASVMSVNPLNEIIKIIDQTVQATQSLTFKLCPPILYELGFVSAVEWLAEQFEKDYGLLVKVEDDDKPKKMDNNTSFFLFQAVRELLVNTVKHAQADRARVSIRKDNEMIHILIEDDGMGLNISPDTADLYYKGYGLFNIRERIRHLGGYLEIESRPGQGTRVSLAAPLSPKEAVQSKE